jgi:DNA-binding response OmpR family regulator
MEKPVLVIEHDQDILNIIEYVLSEQGYDVISFNHLLQPETVIAKHPSIILLDDRLPNGLGGAFCMELKSNDLTTNIPVILLSTSLNAARVAATCKADGFLSKPFDLRELVNLVRRHID